MNIFKKMMGAIIFIPKSIFEASQEGAELLNSALEKADGSEKVDKAEMLLVDLVCLALSTQGIQTSAEQKEKAKKITVESLNKANPKARKLLINYAHIGD